MIRAFRFSLSILAIALAAGLAARADAPHVYAITGARLVTVAGPAVASGTIVVRNGLIEAVGAGVQPPADAVIIDGAGLTVYPGLIDMGTSVGLDIDLVTQQPSTIRTFDESERWKRDLILRSGVLAGARQGRCARADQAGGGRHHDRSVDAAGSSLQGTQRARERRHPGRISHRRRDCSAPQWRGHREVARRAARAVSGAARRWLSGRAARGHRVRPPDVHRRGVSARARGPLCKSAGRSTRPRFDSALDGLNDTLGGNGPAAPREPVAFEANLEREIVRALDMAKEFSLAPIITGGQEADLAAADLKAAKASVILSLNYPTRSRGLAPDADEPARELRLRAHSPKVAAGLEKASVAFAFSSSGLTNTSDFVKNAARAVKEGLTPEAAIRALTLDAARIAGVADRLGSLEKGKIANVIMSNGDLFAERTTVTLVLIDGQRVNLEAPETPRGRGGRYSGERGPKTKDPGLGTND